MRAGKTILCFSGHDPSGGAGIQADIETALAHDVHCASIITAFTVQDSSNVFQVEYPGPGLVEQQIECLEQDMAFDAIKIGMPGDPEIIRVIASFLQRHDNIPVILDPVLAAGGGHPLSTGKMVDCIREHLLPRTFLLTPNLPEFQELGSRGNEKVTLETATEEQHVQQLFQRGVKNLLVTGTHEETPDIEHRLYTADSNRYHFSGKRLKGSFHGSGCTLAAAITCLVALGNDTRAAVEGGLAFTASALEQATSPGKGQLFPRRR